MGDALDPNCADLRRLRSVHAQQARLFVGDGAGRLAQTVRGRQEEELRAHAMECAQCQHHALLPTRCAVCDGALAREGDRLVCRGRAHLLKALLRGKPRASRDVPVPPMPPPAARLASRPPPPPPPPARTQPQPAPKRIRPATAAPSRDPVEEACRVLGVPRKASPEELRAAYREKAHLYHPDKVMHLPPAEREVADQCMKELNEAYQTLRRLATH